MVVEICFMSDFTQENAPLLEALINYSQKGIIPFHMPGHRGGRGLPPLFREMGGSLLTLDLTELAGWNQDRETDYLLRRAERLAAEAFGADRTYFLVNGASVGITAALTGLGGAGKKILMARDCHLSAINGLILSGMTPVFIPPDWLDGLPILPPVRRIEEFLRRNPGTAGLFVTNPGYHGVYGPLREVAEAAKRAGIPLLVDEAHGGHLRYLGLTGGEAASAGADLWVWGVHKLMGSLTQTGMLHLRSGLLDPARVEAALGLLTTTSPSYILLASLDATRRELYFHGRERFTRAAELGETIRGRLRNINRIKLVGGEGLPSGYGLDPTKITLSLRLAGWSGIGAEEVLRKKYRIQPEYADTDYLYFFISYVQTEEEVEAMIRACLALAGTAGPEGRAGEDRFEPPPWSGEPLPLSPREAFQSPAEQIPLPQAAGRLAAQVVAAYPPGIPLWAPGEMITPELVEWAERFQKSGGCLRGVEDNSVRVIK